MVEIASKIQPSPRGELEIIDVNKAYLALRDLHLEKIGRGIAWLYTGTHESLLQASHFVETIEQRQGLKVACIEEVAFRMRYISSEEVLILSKDLQKNNYGKYLLKTIQNQGIALN